MFSPRDMTAMALKFLLSRAEMKDLHVQFGAILTVFDRCTEVGMCAIVKVLMTDARSRVYWDRSEAGMLKAADLTKGFTGLPGAVVAMIDGKKLESLYPSDLSDQNRDYNGWTHDVFRNLVVVWDPEGKIVDVGVNLPGNFHDSKSTLWCHVYDHIAALPDGHIVVCDSAFTCSGDMEGKLYKLKDKKDKDGEWENSEPTELDAMLTHIRQCAEWGNNVLTGCFRRLKQRLPTDNV